MKSAGRRLDRRRILVRPRLLGMLAGDWRVAVLSAPAGFGKTTLATQVADRHRGLWCSVGPDERDPRRLLGTMLAAGAMRSPPFGTRTRRLLGASREFERDGPLLTASLLDDLAHAATGRPRLLVVLDDVHHLEGAGDTLRWLARIVDASDRRVRFLLACRGECPVALARHELSGELVRIDADALAFTPAERALLMARLAGPDGSRGGVPDEGWPAAFVLAARASSDGSGPGASPDPAVDALARFFEQEAMQTLPPDVVRALERAALADDLDPTTLRVLVGPDWARRLVGEATRRDLFVQRTPAAAVRFHPLFRDFLRRRWHPPHREVERRRLLLRLARHHQQRGETVRAVRALAEAGDLERVARAFERAPSRRVTRDPAMGAVALEITRGGRAAGSPWLSLQAALEAREARHYDEAMRLTREATAAFLGRGRPVEAARVYRIEASTALLQGPLGPTIAHGLALLRRLPARAALARGIVATDLGQLELNAGAPARARTRLVAAERMLGRGRASIERADAAVRLGMVDYSQGDWESFRNRARAALVIYRRAGYGTRAWSLLINLAEASTWLGEEDHALAALDEAEALRARVDVPAAPAFEAIGRARATSERGDLDRAGPLFEAADAAVRHEGVPHLGLQAQVWRGMHERRAGRLAEAERRLEAAVRGFAALPSPAWTNFARMERALVRGLRGHAAAARADLAGCARVSTRLGDLKERARVLLYDARLRLQSGVAFAPAFGRALDELERLRWLVLLRKEADVAEPLLLALEPGDPRRQRHRHAVPGSSSARLERTPLQRTAGLATAPRLRLALLGPFRAEVDGRPVRFTRRAAELLVARLALHPMPLTREALAESLWPNAPPRPSRNRFDVTLNAARRGLEPEADRRGPFRVLVADHDACRLAGTVETDVAEFERLCRRAEPHLGVLLDAPAATRPEPRRAARRALPILESAVRAYGGELLTGVDAAWVTAERSRLRDRWQRVVCGVAAARLASGAARAAVEAARSVIDEDPLHEEAVRLLIRACAAAGDRATALKAYRAFVQRLRRELDADPSPWTLALARELLGPDVA